MNDLFKLKEVLWDLRWIITPWLPFMGLHETHAMSHNETMNHALRLAHYMVSGQPPGQALVNKVEMPNDQALILKGTVDEEQVTYRIKRIKAFRYDLTPLILLDHNATVKLDFFINTRESLMINKFIYEIYDEALLYHYKYRSGKWFDLNPQAQIGWFEDLEDERKIKKAKEKEAKVIADLGKYEIQYDRYGYVATLPNSMPDEMKIMAARFGAGLQESILIDHEVKDPDNVIGLTKIKRIG